MTNTCRDVEKGEYSYVAHGNETSAAIIENRMELPRKPGVEPPHDPALHYRRLNQ
jgi:hypothetical protein